MMWSGRRRALNVQAVCGIRRRPRALSGGGGRVPAACTARSTNPVAADARRRAGAWLIEPDSSVLRHRLAVRVAIHNPVDMAGRERDPWYDTAETELARRVGHGYSVTSWADGVWE